MDSRTGIDRTDLTQPPPAVLPAVLVELVRLLARQAAREAVAAALSADASDVIQHEPEDRP